MSPFLGDDDMETINNISKGEFEYPDPDPEEGYEDISEKAKNFIDDLIQMRPVYVSLYASLLVVSVVQFGRKHTESC